MGKIALITGASSGIGESTALLLKEKGFIVYGAARRVERMKSLEKAGVNVLKMDLTDDESIKSCVRTIIDKEGTIDVLVNNAGYGSCGALEDVPMSEARKQFEVNIFGLARLVQLVLPSMRKQMSGNIINISSIGGKYGGPHGTWYHASKFAVEGLSDSIRMELKQFNINVVVIQPGAIKTEWFDIATEQLIEVSGHTAYGRLAKAHAAMLKKYSKKGSDPIVIAKVILKAINSKSPKTRYSAGKGAHIAGFMRKILPEKLMDKFMLSMMTR